MSEAQEGAGREPAGGRPRREATVREVDFRELEKGPGGCGLTGCLYGTVGVFALLLVVMLFIVLTRVWMTPATLPGSGMP